MGAISRCIIQGRSHLGRGELKTQPQGHYAAVPVDAGNPFTVIAHRGNHPGNLCAVTVNAPPVDAFRSNIIVVIPKVPPVDVIDIAVLIVIHTVIGNLVLVNPDIVFQVGMIHINTGIQHGDHDIVTTG